MCLFWIYFVALWLGMMSIFSLVYHVCYLSFEKCLFKSSACPIPLIKDPEHNLDTCRRMLSSKHNNYQLHQKIYDYLQGTPSPMMGLVDWWFFIERMGSITGPSSEILSTSSWTIQLVICNSALTAVALRSGEGNTREYRLWKFNWREDLCCTAVGKPTSMLRGSFLEAWLLWDHPHYCR